MVDLPTLLKENIKDAVKSAYSIDADNVLLEHPENEKFGDWSTNIGLVLSKKIVKNPIEISQNIVHEIKNNELNFELDGDKYPIFSSIEVEKPGFINFTLSDYWLKYEISRILDKKDRYGSSNIGEGKIIIVEYSAPNPNKPLHIGHSRNNFLGSSISNIFCFTGYNVIKMNYMNDWGTHICKSMLMYKKYGTNKDPDKKTDHFVGDYYRMFETEYEKYPKELDKELSDIFKKLEDGDEETVNLWKKITNWAYEGWKPTYENENVSFDIWEYQSNYTKSGRDIVDLAIKIGIAEKDSTGAVIAKLSKYDIPDKVLLRSDGTPIYITQDMYMAKENYEKYGFDKRYYVVDKRQSDYFKQLFRILELLGFDWVKKLHHVSYGWISLPDGAMSSRLGTVVSADDVFNKLVDIEKEEIKESLKEITNIEKTTKKIALSAYRYGMLKVDSKQDIVFDLKKVTSFEGNTGPYLMYTYARAMSILEKSGMVENELDFNLELFGDSKLNEKESTILRSIQRFPETVLLASEEVSPHIIANYLYSFAQKFNSFYGDTPVLNAEESIKDFRVLLVYSASVILKNGLGLLGIDVVEKM